jgi:hypothetical protein
MKEEEGLCTPAVGRGASGEHRAQTTAFRRRDSRVQHLADPLKRMTGNTTAMTATSCNTPRLPSGKT